MAISVRAETHMYLKHNSVSLLGHVLHATAFCKARDEPGEPMRYAAVNHEAMLDT